MKKNSGKRGVATIELLIALAILVLNMTALVLLVSGGQNISIDAETNTDAIVKAQALLNHARAEARGDFFALASIPLTSDGIYKKSLTVTDDPDNFNIKNVTSHVAWNLNGKDLSIDLNTIISNPSGAIDTCNPTLSGDWSIPRTMGTADFGENNGATDVFVLAKKAYATADPSSFDKEDFYLIDVSQPDEDNLPILKKLNTGPGAAAVHANGKYAYVANKSTTAQLHIIDTSKDPMEIVGSLDLTSPGDSAVGNSVFYNKKKVYLGLTKSSGPEFYVIDVSDPNNPKKKAWFETNTKVTEIIVRNGVAYLSVPDDAATATKEQLRILDVSQTDTDSTISQINSWGNNAITMSGEGMYLSRDGKKLYLGEGGVPSSSPDIFGLNVTNPGSIPSPSPSKDIGTSASAVTVRSNLVFFITPDPNDDFQIWDLNDLSSPYATLNIEQGVTGGLSCEGNLMFVAQRSNKALQIIGPGLNPASVALEIHNADHNNISSGSVDAVVHAKATVSGAVGIPTGKLDFTFFSNNNCASTGTADASNSFSLSGGSVESSNSSALAAGNYSYKAYYRGDTNYSPKYSSCVDLTVTKEDPSVVTVIKNNAGVTVTSVPFGTVVHDEVTVAGNGPAPTGTANFTLYQTKTDCSGGATTTYNNIALSSGVAKTPNFTTQKNKSISYLAHYNGDANYNAKDAVCEPLIVN